MSDDEEVYSSEEEGSEEEEEEEEVEVKEEEHIVKKNEDKREESIFGQRKEPKTSELDEQLKDYIAEWRKQRSKEEEELKRLKEKQSKRKVLRATEEKRLAEAKKGEDERRLREEAERKQKEMEEKMRRLEEAEKKRQLLAQAQSASSRRANLRTSGGHKEEAMMSNVKPEVAKTKEQLAEEKRVALGVRIRPLKIENLSLEALKKKADELWVEVVRLETEKYDLEERGKRQDYDLKELNQRQKMQLRHKAVRLGLEPEALTGKHPPKIQVASKFERTIDRRTYVDKKDLFSGGIMASEKEHMEKSWTDKIKEFDGRSKARLPRWFGERPGKKAGDAETPDDDKEEDAPLDDDLALDPLEQMDDEEEAEEEEEEEEESEEE